MPLIIRNILKTIQNRHGKKLNTPNGLKKKDPLCKRCPTTDPMEAGKRKAGELPCISVGKNCRQIWT